ncbi:uncharacterized protein MELLADRAFT_47989 [Melampsora larici-populina 98AG31]|uniref:Ca2+:H+ antiporter n=1 Tax=Melampsora larici-populina (strain 98AG31 / pathotype 3-4-7) TaxID=747676 RepID=F4RIK4_MELLP|nr:uncharacterized protein MELLADRAFT_47989 [Melampsora larici-populina 98AG31]EGG07582.1 hypothetical protein MELLADRAFT_47989 [Melampsora larici-populina 98AG31]
MRSPVISQHTNLQLDSPSRPKSTARHASVYVPEASSSEEGQSPQGEADGNLPAEAENASSDNASSDLNDEDVEYTLKDRQDAINIEHPFGLPIWKPALYKKSRSVARNAEAALHDSPTSTSVSTLTPGNILWALLFGSPLAFVFSLVAAVLFVIPWGGSKYGRVVWELAGYLIWPFGKYVEEWSEEEEGEEGEEGTQQEEAANTLDVHSSRWEAVSDIGDDDNDNESVDRLTIRGDAHERTSLTAAEAGPDRLNLPPNYGATHGTRPRLSNQHKYHPIRVRALGRLSFWTVYYLIIAPMMLASCVLCWFFVFPIPMAKLLWVLVRHVGTEPLALHFRSPPTFIDLNQIDGKAKVLLCTYKALGIQYYKYTVDGVNIIFIILMPFVIFVIFDAFFLVPLHLTGFLGVISSQAVIFVMALLSVVPLSYFIGMAVASISAQSSIGMGAVINATFGSIIEILLYGIALTEGKGDLVEGSIIGSVLAGVLLMPGMSMIGGSVRRKEQKFNARSAGVTSTMLIMAIIGVLTPTLFYEIYGTFQLTCSGCPDGVSTKPGEINTEALWKCQSCRYEHLSPVNDEFYQTSVKGLSYYCAALLVLSYLIGLWFSLRTHASQIWQTPAAAPHTADHEPGGGSGHDAPNWSRNKSTTVLLSCTLLYAVIAEILVSVVDVVLDGSGIPEKLLGVTLFALVPNTTEFMNAISFAMNGNIALSMEIGSAYALQVCLIQIPAMIAISAIYNSGKYISAHHTFTLVFPRWDVISIVFSVFLLTYTYIEARANYHRGTILVLSYLVLVGGFYSAPVGGSVTEGN